MVISRTYIGAVYTGIAYDNLLVAVRGLRDHRVALHVGAYVQVNKVASLKNTDLACSACHGALLRYITHSKN